MRSRVLALAVCFAGLGAAPAGAATVWTDGESFWFTPIYLQAAPGEVNTLGASYARDVTQTLLQALPFPFETFPGRTTITDSSTPLTAGPGCRQIDANTVDCPPGPLHASLGDGDDSADLETLAGSIGGPPFNGFEAVVLGGAGNDSLTSSEASAFLAGEDGNDALTGAPTLVDGFAGGAGDDDIQSLDSNAEDVFCGPGDDATLHDPLDRRASSCERIGLD